MHIRHTKRQDKRASLEHVRQVASSVSAGTGSSTLDAGVNGERVAATALEVLLADT